MKEIKHIMSGERQVKAIISIPVHERPDVILDQIANINRFFPEADIVLHVSAAYFEKYEIKPIMGQRGVFINPEHMKTGWGNIFLTHVSNFEYIESLGYDYDYFVFHSSNDMYVRSGAAQYIQKYDAGFNLHYLTQKYTYWWPCACAWEDPGLEACMEEIGQTRIVATQVEGSFYKMDIARTIMQTIRNCINSGKVCPDKGVYGTREEIFFSTLGECLIPRDRIGRPFVFSEVHRFDRELWKTFTKADLVYRKFLHYILPGKGYNKLKKIYNDFKFKCGKYKTTSEIVDRIRSQDTEYIEKNRFLCDGSSTFELYRNAASLFAVKRVERDFDDPLRKYIRNLPEETERTIRK